MAVAAHSLDQRLAFAPPQTRGMLPAVLLALLVHLMLVGALTLTVQWKHQVESPVIDAELWSAVPALAAAKAVEPPVPEPPQITPLTPRVQAEPPPTATPPPPAPEVKDAEIALERDKQRLAEQQRRALLEQQKQAKAETQAQEKREKEKLAKEKLAQEKLAQDKLELERKLAEKEKEQSKDKKREAEQRLAAQRQEQSAKTDKADKAKLAAAKAEADARHDAEVKRILGSAGASGDANATGTALRSSGPSTNYAGRIAARIKPNIVFTDDVPGNPVAEVEVRTAPDGTIVGTPRLVKSSGFKNWDDAVIKAIIKTEVLPRDIDGRVPSVIPMAFRPKD